MIVLRSLGGVAAVVRHSMHSMRSSSAVASGAGSNGTAVIEPKLRPGSDKKFFKADYTNDSSPKSGDGFEFRHPYPVLQDSRSYEKDFVKDENSDSGEWHAQSTYDNLRTKLELEKVEVQTALEHERQGQKELELTKTREADAEQDSKDAELSVQEAKRRLEQAQAIAKRISGGQGGRSDGGKIGEAVQEVNHEITDVAACERQVAKVQAELERLLKEKKTRENARKEAAGSKAAAEAAYQTAKQAKYEKLDHELIAKAKLQEQEHDQALAEYQGSDAEMEQLEIDIQKAAEQLRQARRSADSSGEMTTTKSGARSAGSALSHMALLLLLLQLLPPDAVTINLGASL